MDDRFLFWLLEFFKSLDIDIETENFSKKTLATLVFI
jgi:hypothetical protein